MAEVGWPTILPNTKYERRRMLELERTLGVFDIDFNFTLTIITMSVQY